MGIFSKIFKRDAETSSNTQYLNIVGINDVGGTSVVYVSTADAADCVSAANRCIDLISSSVATAPLQYLRKKDGVFSVDEDNPINILLQIEPQREYSKFNFWKAAVKQMICSGNAYIVPRSLFPDGFRYGAAHFDVGGDDELVLCSPDSVSFDSLNGVYTIHDIRNGINATFVERDVIHLYMRESEWRTGMKLLEYAKRVLSIAATGDNETLDRFGNGGNVRGLVGNDTSVQGMGEYQDEELARLATSMDSKFRAGNRIVAVPGQVNFVPLSLSSTDIQFLETRKFEVLEVCRLFGVPPTFVYADTSNNYKSVEMASVDFLNQTLNPILEMIETELQRKLISRSKWLKRKIEFDRLGVYRLDIASRLANDKLMLETGMKTQNEIRRGWNLMPVEGGDVLYHSNNMIEISGEANTEPPVDNGEPDARERDSRGRFVKRSKK